MRYTTEDAIQIIVRLSAHFDARQPGNLSYRLLGRALKEQRLYASDFERAKERMTTSGHPLIAQRIAAIERILLNEMEN